MQLLYGWPSPISLAPFVRRALAADVPAAELSLSAADLVGCDHELVTTLATMRRELQQQPDRYAGPLQELLGIDDLGLPADFELRLATWDAFVAAMVRCGPSLFPCLCTSALFAVC